MVDSSAPEGAPYHAHIYADPGELAAAETLRAKFAGDAHILFVGRLTKGKAGPHPIPQFEVHFRKAFLEQVLDVIEASGLRALVHPLTDNDLADHTSLAHWIGEPVALDLETLDPPGVNQGMARFGRNDF